MSALRRPPRRPVLAVVAAVVLLALGAGVAVGLTAALGIETSPKTIPVDNPVAAPATAAVLPPELTIAQAPDSPRMTLALTELEGALAAAPATEGAATLTITAGDDTADESYTLTGTPEALNVTAPGIAGATLAVYDLAAAVRDGRSILTHLGETVTPRLSFRMVDLGAAGVEPDPAEWTIGTDYSHNSKAFQRAILPEAPYVDRAVVDELRPGWEAYVAYALAQGANAIAVPGFLEYVDFRAIGVYPDGDPHIARAEAMREAFGPLWQYAHDLGLKVYFRTDMLALDPPLESYLTDRFGRLDTENPELWEVYAAGQDELAQTMPYVDGLLLRIGEGGAIYKLPGWDYTSSIQVTTVAGVRAMLTTLLAHAEDLDKEVIFRTWSVGIGDVGDIHIDPASYHAALDGIDSPALIVSTKYSAGDFYSYLPLNTTLETGDQRRIIEFQSRREYESFGSFPNDLGDLSRTALDTFLAANPHVEGVWVWTQDGGPWRAGPMTLVLTSGFWQLADLNTTLVMRLARDPELDPAEITNDWIHRWFSDDPATVDAIAAAMADSREAITDGLYIGPWAEQTVVALGLHPPPSMWMFEWDILTGDSAALDTIASITLQQGRLDEAIAQGRHAVEVVDAMRAAVGGTDPAAWKSAELRDELLASLDYEASTLGLLADYRAAILQQGRWHATGDPAAYAAWAEARDAYLAAAQQHLATYTGDPFHPPLQLTAAQLGIDRADRDLPMAWAARVLAALAGGWLLLGLLAEVIRRGRPVPRVVAAARAAWIAATRPWRAAEVVAGLGRVDRVLLAAVPGALLIASHLVHTWLLAPAHLLVTLGGWALFALVVVGAAMLLGRAARPGDEHARARDRVLAVLATLGGVAVARTALLMAVDAPTGPGGYWYGFWTDPTARSLYVTVAFALFAWAVVATAWTLAVALGARRALGVALAGVGAVMTAVGLLVRGVGLEESLTVWNDQMGLLPWGLARILGITTYLEIPQDTPLLLAAPGAVLLAVGLGLALVGRARRVRAA
ncbi:MAG: hypothetical protein J0G30_02390 [Actinomycetales bacterium]|nr:hypothetical protein [Actinomycetales bacterium]